MAAAALLAGSMVSVACLSFFSFYDFWILIVCPLRIPKIQRQILFYLFFKWRSWLLILLTRLRTSSPGFRLKGDQGSVESLSIVHSYSKAG